ncbi:LamG domain-containing protein [Candidatus Parcubacteria bacterium]|nr:MAG: LamG domain-containing protein [Candidatus Parcubacteria bacterium]
MTDANDAVALLYKEAVGDLTDLDRTTYSLPARTIGGATSGRKTYRDIINEILKQTGAKLIPLNNGKLAYWQFNSGISSEAFEFNDYNAKINSVDYPVNGRIVNSGLLAYDEIKEPLPVAAFLSKDRPRNFRSIYSIAEQTGLIATIASESNSIYGNKPLSDSYTQLNWLDTESEVDNLVLSILGQYATERAEIELEAPAFYPNVKNIELADVVRVTSTDLPAQEGTDSTCTAKAPVSVDKHVFSSFNGTSQYATIADNADLSGAGTSFTICGWFNFTSFAECGLIAKYTFTGNQREYLLYYNAATTSIKFLVSNDGVNNTTVTATSLGTPTTGTWYFIVCEYDATAQTISIQVNNGTIDSTSHTAGVYDSTARFEIGSYGGAGGNLFNGTAGLCAKWNRTLTSTERAQLYNNGEGLTYDQLPAALKIDLKAYWHLGSDLKDYHGANNLTDNGSIGTADGPTYTHAVNYGPPIRARSMLAQVLSKQLQLDLNSRNEPTFKFFLREYIRGRG